jgi:hypothetical protein
MVWEATATAVLIVVAVVPSLLLRIAPSSSTNHCPLTNRYKYDLIPSLFCFEFRNLFFLVCLCFLNVLTACVLHCANDGGASLCIAGFVVPSLFTGWLLCCIIIVTLVTLPLLSYQHVSNGLHSRFLQHDYGIALCYGYIAVFQFDCEGLADLAEEGAELLKGIRSTRLHDGKYIFEFASFTVFSLLSC